MLFILSFIMQSVLNLFCFTPSLSLISYDQFSTFYDTRLLFTPSFSPATVCFRPAALRTHSISSNTGFFQPLLIHTFLSAIYTTSFLFHHIQTFFDYLQYLFFLPSIFNQIQYARLFFCLSYQLRLFSTT